MKIAIDISPLESAHKYRGTGSYTKNLVKALKKYKPENKYILFTRTSKLPKDVDLVHYPCFDPFFLTLPLHKSYKTVVTIHDLIPLIFTDKFPRGFRGEIKWQIQKFSLKSASAIITDSDVSKRDIVKFTKFPEEKIYVVPLAPGEQFRLQATSYKLQAKTRRKYSLPERFILYVGDVNWNKNIPGLIKAFKQLVTSEVSSSYTSEVGLVLVGKAFQDEKLKETQEINQLIDKLGIANSVLKLGFVPTGDLVAVYNLASVYCQPSFYEGFGLPVLEAMACGTPVVVSAIPVLREIAGQAVIYVDPNDISNIALGMKQASELSGLNHLTLVKEGLKQAKKFSWEKVAEETVKVYKKTVG